MNNWLEAIQEVHLLEGKSAVTSAFTATSNYHGCPKPESLQRRLQGAFLNRVKRVVKPSWRMLDVANGSPRLGTFLGVRDVETMDIGDTATYKENITGECASVPKESYDLITCLNYLLLCENPEKAMANIFSFLKPGGLAILDFIGTTYWYRAPDGVHWQSYTPDKIHQLTSAYSEHLIVPVGNFAQAFINYYAKRLSPRLRRFPVLLGALAGRFDKSPTGALHYFCLAKKG